MALRNVIGGYMPGPHGVDSIIVGYYKGELSPLKVPAEFLL